MLRLSLGRDERLQVAVDDVNIESVVFCQMSDIFCVDLFELFYSIAEAISPEAFV